jgi:PAS domain S-box-containing protein
MNSQIRMNPSFQALREKAEQLVAGKRANLPDTDEPDLVSLVHEIEIQHVELELQNQQLRHALQDLEDSRNKFFNLYQTAPVAFVTVNEKGLIEQANEAAARLFAGSTNHLIGRSFVTLILLEDRQVYFSFLRELALHKGTSRCGLRLKNGKDHIAHVQLEATATHDEQGRRLQWRFGMLDVTKLKQSEDALKRARDELEERVARRTAELDQRNKQLARLTSELTIAEQRERRRLAEVLHDHLQQLLAGARLNLEMAVQENASTQDSALKTGYDLVIQSLETSRTLSVELSPPVLYMHGLAEAFKWLARWMTKAHNLQVDLHAEQQADPPQEELKILLFQSVRELLFNVVKHAGTTAARLEMRRQDERIVIVVSDAGSGFDPEGLWGNDRSSDKAYGLFNIRERLMLLDGTFGIVSRPSGGTTVTLTAPLQTAAFRQPEPIVVPQLEVRNLGRPEATNRKPGGTVRVLLVDDHAVMRQGLSLMLSGHEDIEIVGEAADGNQAIEAACRLNPDIILMDISMPVMNGIEATRQIHALLPHIRIIALSMYSAEDQNAAMQAAGAAAYLSKTGSPDDILSTILESMGRSSG